MNEMFAILGIGLSVFCFLMLLLGLGEFYGGDWETVAQGVTVFILVIVGFALGAFVLMKVVEKR